MKRTAAREPVERDLRPPLPLILVIAFLCVGIIAGSVLAFRNYERQFRAQAEQQLSAIAELKVSELTQWRKERLGDAAVFLHDKPFIDIVRRLRDHPGDAVLRAQILALLGIIRKSYQYDSIQIVDPRGEILLASPEAAGAAGPVGWPEFPEILSSGRISFLDFRRDTPGGPIYLAVVAPLREETAGAEPLGAALLRIDPAAYLYPFIQRWPTPSRTAETLIVRREGDEVAFLNDLRFRPGSALAFKLPLTDRSLPAAAAVCGYTGIMNGRDYRGVPVVSDVRPVPDSPWFLSARIDAAEVFAPLKERLWLMIGLVAALLFGTAAAALGAWRRIIARSYRVRYEAEKKLRAVSARQEALYAAIPDIIMEVDAEKRYVWANRAGLAFFGEDVIGKKAADYFEGEQETYRTVQPLFNGREDVIYVESWQRRKDGTKRLLGWRCRVLQDDRGRVTGALSSAQDITEQRQAEAELIVKHRELQASVQQLELSRNLLQLIIESIPLRVFWKDRDLRYLGCNSLFARDAGFSRPEELLGRDDFVMGWKEQAGLYPVDDREVMASGPKINIIEPQTTPAGETIWLNTSKVPLRNADGEVFGMLGIYEDITDRKRAAEALRESEEKFRGLFDNMIEGVALHEIVTDEAGRATDYRILDANPAFGRYTTIPPEAARGRLASELYGAPAPHLETYARVAATAEPAQFESVFGPADVIFFVSVFSPKPGTFATVFEDITARKRAEEELRCSEAFLATIIDKSPLAMWVSDERGTLLRLNQALKDLLQITEDDVVGKYNVFQDDIVERQGYMPLVRNVYERGEVARFPLIYDTAALQHLRWAHPVSVILEITISPVKGAGGRVTNAVVQVVDVTERVRAEEALRASLKEKEVLLREIHHRVKNNMQVISSLLNLQGASLPDPQIRDLLKESQLRIRSMALVHERLYGSGDLSHIDFADYLRKLCVHLGQAFSLDSDRVDVRLDLEEIPVDINSAIPCGLIATELISNAMKHAFPEGRRGTLGVALKRIADGRIRLTVSDDGVGFPPRIDFRKTDSLGLQIVNLLSQQIEGRVELAAGPGTSFSVDFPEVLYKKRL